MRDRMPNSCYGAKGVRPWPQMGHRAQVFEAVLLLTDRVVFRILDRTDNRKLGYLDFSILPFTSRFHDLPRKADGEARREFKNIVVIGQFLVSYRLDVVKTRTIVDVDEGEASLRTSPGTYPTAQFYLLIEKFIVA